MGCETSLRELLVHYGKCLHDQALVSGTDGNLSVRLEDGSILCTPTAMSKGEMHPADMVVVDLNGKVLRGDRCPSSEMLMHLTIYRERPDIQAVIHAHPPTATGFAAAGMALDQPICSEVIISLGAVPLAEYATPGTPGLSDSLRPFVPHYDAILLANHGAVAYDVDLESAYFKMETVEHLAKVTLVAHQLGGAQNLTEEQINALVEARSKYQGKKSLATLPPGPIGSKLWVAKSIIAMLIPVLHFGANALDTLTDALA